MRTFIVALWAIVIGASFAAPPPLNIGRETPITHRLKTNDTIPNWRDMLGTPGWSNFTLQVFQTNADRAIRFAYPITDPVWINPPNGTNAASDLHIQKAFSVQAGYTDLRAFGAIEGGTVDAYAAITNALEYCSQNNVRLDIHGTYLISQPVDLPLWVAIQGTAVDQGYKNISRRPKRSVIKTSGDFTALRTPRLPEGFDTSSFWATYISIKDIYLEGPGSQSMADSASVGLDITGSFFAQINNVHAEGFGTGMVFHNISDMFVYEPYVQNCYRGIRVKRTDFRYDCIAVFINPVIINNRLTWELDNPRAVFVHGGTSINNLNLALPMVSIINVKDDSQIVFSQHVMENQSQTDPRFETDSSGLGTLIVENCNLSVDQNVSIVEANGQFDLIKVTGNQFQRFAPETTPIHAPIVWAKATPNDNGYYRGNRIIVENNTPNWYDAFVRNDQPSARPENDFIPTGFINLNPHPNTDKFQDGITEAYGDFGFTWTNNWTGSARVFWRSSPTNNHILLWTGTNYTRGVDQIYVTATVYDNGGLNVPELYVEDWGTNGVNWQAIAKAKIGEFNIGGVTFSKWAWTGLPRAPSLATNGLWKVQLLNVYGTNDANQAKYGMERFSVYAPGQKNASEWVRNRKPMRPSPPSSGLEGYYNVGDFIWNDHTLTTNVVGWVCRVAGQPGHWMVAGGDVYGTGTYRQHAIPRFKNLTDNGLEPTDAFYTEPDRRLRFNSDRLIEWGPYPGPATDQVGVGGHSFYFIMNGQQYFVVSSNSLSINNLTYGWPSGHAAGFLQNNGSGTLTWGTPTTPADVLVKVTSSDTTAGYLAAKLVAGSNITITTNNAGGVETLTIAATVAGGGGTYNFIAPLTQTGDDISIAANGIANSHLRQSAAVSVIGRAASSVGNPSDIVATADNQIFGRYGGTLSFDVLPEDLSNQRVNILTNGVSVGTRKSVNLIEGANTTLTVADNAGANRVDVTVTTAAGAGTNITYTSSGDLIEYEGVDTGVSDYTLTDTYAVVDFGDGATMNTGTLEAGTYILTAVLDFNQYRDGGQQILARLFNEYSGFAVEGSEKLVGPQILAGQFLGEWIAVCQGKVTLPEPGSVSVQARYSVSGDLNSSVRKNRSTLSWIKVL